MQNSKVDYLSHFSSLSGVWFGWLAPRAGASIAGERNANGALFVDYDGLWRSEHGAFNVEYG